MKRNKLMKRINSLYQLEFFNAFWLPAIYFFLSYLMHQPIGMSSIVAIILNSFILFQGSWVWYNTRRKLSNKPHINFRKYYYWMKSIDIILIIFLVVFLSITPFLGTFEKIGAICFLVLGILEFINYFEYQLMYDNFNDLKFLVRNKKLKIAKLKLYASYSPN